LTNGSVLHDRHDSIVTLTLNRPKSLLSKLDAQLLA